MALSNISHRPLILADFRDIPSGTRLTMWFKRFNEGQLRWLHTRIDGDRLVGRFCHEEKGEEWSREGRYIYEHENVLCINSGREPLWAIPPEKWGAGAWRQESDTSSDEE
jgi:hypothetical protein